MNEAVFDIPAFFVGAGDFFVESYNLVRDYKHVNIAVDGGYDSLKSHRLAVDMVIGDLDSISDRSGIFDDRRTVLMTGQNNTDLEKAFSYIQAPLYICFGFGGDRFDHTLETIHALAKYPDRRIIFVFERDIMFVIPKEWSVSYPKSSRLSLFPIINSHNISAVGLKYPISNMDMSIGVLIGTSNVVVDDEVRLSYDDGALVAITAMTNIESTIASLGVGL
jgi:thiamine pyrophosphokinase